MTMLADLPDELLLEIFEYVSREDVPAILALSTSCRRLHSSTQAILYRHLSFAPDLEAGSSLSRFIIHSVERSLTRSFSLHSFTKHLHPPYDAIQPLFGLLACFTQLTTFSLYLDRTSLGKDEAFDHGLLVQLLQVLPETVVNLEIDTNGCDNLSLQAQLCSALNRVLPRLKSLRLRLSKLCQGLFYNIEYGKAPVAIHCPELRTAVISLYINKRWNHKTMYSESELVIATTDCEYGTLVPLRASSLAKCLRRSFEAGNFPRLKDMLIIDSQSARHALGRRRHLFLRTYNVVDAITVTIPRMSAQVNLDLSKIRTPGGLWQLRDQHGATFCGFEDMMSSCLEGPLHWTTLSNGGRVPSQGLVWPRPQMPDVTALMTEDFIEESYGRFKSYLEQQEHRTGLVLMKTTVDEGLDEPLPPEWELNNRWKHVQTGRHWAIDPR